MSRTPAPEKPALVEVRGLRKYFPAARTVWGRPRAWIRAVDGVDLAVPQGGTTGLVGESGSGKTTLGRLVLRLIPADAGEVLFEGEDLLRLAPAELKRYRRRMQVVFQDPYGSLNPRMRVGSIVAEGLAVYRVGTAGERRERVRELLDLVGLSGEAAERYPHEFSGGQRQRIGIARALALNPDFLVCDEPVSSLDVSVQAQILNLLKELQERLGLTYLFIAHDLAVVEQLADRVAVMYRGKLVELGPAAAVYARPLHPYTRLLLESIPVPDPAVSRPAPPEASPAGAADRGCGFYPRCPRRGPECREAAPVLAEAEPGHRVACFRGKGG